MLFAGISGYKLTRLDRLAKYKQEMRAKELARDREMYLWGYVKEYIPLNDGSNKSELHWRKAPVIKRVKKSVLG